MRVVRLRYSAVLEARPVPTVYGRGERDAEARCHP